MNGKEIGRITSRDGTSIAFERVGTGPPVILVDAAGNFRGFSPMPQLADALSPDFTAFTYDRRGATPAAAACAGRREGLKGGRQGF